MSIWANLFFLHTDISLNPVTQNGLNLLEGRWQKVKEFLNTVPMLFVNHLVQTEITMQGKNHLHVYEYPNPMGIQAHYQISISNLPSFFYYRDCSFSEEVFPNAFMTNANSSWHLKKIRKTLQKRN